MQRASTEPGSSTRRREHTGPVDGIGFVVGAAVGELAGTLKPKVGAVYHAQRNYGVPAVWLLTRVGRYGRLATRVRLAI